MGHPFFGWYVLRTRGTPLRCVEFCVGAQRTDPLGRESDDCGVARVAWGYDRVFGLTPSSHSTSMLRR